MHGFHHEKNHCFVKIAVSKAHERDQEGLGASNLDVFHIMNSNQIYSQWIGLRENLQETMDFPIKYGVFL